MRRGALHPGGPEIGVASTKTFLAQIAANYLVGLALAQARGTKYTDEVAREYHELEAMPALVAEVLTRMDAVADIAAASPTRPPCCSSAATSATRWPSKAR